MDLFDILEMRGIEINRRYRRVMLNLYKEPAVVVKMDETEEARIKRRVRQESSNRS